MPRPDSFHSFYAPHPSLGASSLPTPAPTTHHGSFRPGEFISSSAPPPAPRVPLSCDCEMQESESSRPLAPGRKTVRYNIHSRVPRRVSLKLLSDIFCLKPYLCPEGWDCGEASEATREQNLRGHDSQTHAWTSTQFAPWAPHSAPPALALLAGPPPLPYGKPDPGRLSRCYVLETGLSSLQGIRLGLWSPRAQSGGTHVVLGSLSANDHAPLGVALRKGRVYLSAHMTGLNCLVTQSSPRLLPGGESQHMGN